MMAGMVGVGVFARFKAKPDSGAEIVRFCEEGLPIVEAQPKNTVWSAFGLNGTSYGALAGLCQRPAKFELRPVLCGLTGRAMPPSPTRGLP